MTEKTGVLLINLGTPNSPSNRDVYRYLIEFLTDNRVIDFNWFKRQLLVRGLIVPLRYRQSAKSYREVWTKEGSPLMVYGKKVKEALQKSLGNEFRVELAMRYQNPSIKEGLHQLLNTSINHLIVIPLFPQYASATTGSVHEALMKELSKLEHFPKITFVSQYPTDKNYIRSCSTIAKEYTANGYDHILFSFHGLPERHLRKKNPSHCCKKDGCYHELNAHNQFCYAAQCYATAKAIAQEINLSNNYSICFQSRLGKEPWLQPYASETIHQLATQGKKRVLVLSPSFVADCLETIHEIGVEYAEEFKALGGEELTLVPSLNDHPLWIDTLKGLIKNET